MSTPERSPERDAALMAVLPHVAELGWTYAALTAAVGPDADLLFPGGPADMVEAYCDLADRWMTADMAARSVDELRLPQRVRAAIVVRLQRAAPHRDAVRRALTVLAMPGRTVLAARCTVRTIDAIWYAAGDTSADFSWYTKRAILTGVYGATLLFWLQDYTEDFAATLGFLDRRLASVGRIGRLRRKLSRQRNADLRDGAVEPQ